MDCVGLDSTYSVRMLKLFFSDFVDGIVLNLNVLILKC